MKSIHATLGVCSALLLCSTAAHAVSLTGTMLIDPGIVIPAPDANSSPTYVSGSFFAMGGEGDADSRIGGRHRVGHLSEFCAGP